jgi:MFS family permease
VPFWLSAIVVVAGVLIRRRLDETPVFEAAAREGEIRRAPVGELLRDHRAAVLRVVLVALGSTVSTIFAVYALSYAVDTKGLDKTTMLWVAIVTNAVALVAIPLWAMLADRIGRKPVLIGGTLASGALMFAYLAAIDSKSYVLIFLAAIAMSGVVYSAYNGVQPALYGEMFPTKVRLSGMAVGTQIGYAIGGFAPTAAAAIDGGGWAPVAAYVLLASVIAAIAAATARETCREPLQQLDERPTRRFARRPDVAAETTAVR